MRRADAGFTLVELAVVILLIGIAVTLAMPRVGPSALYRARIAASANRLAAVATHARDRAIFLRKAHVLCVDEHEQRYQVFVEEEGARSEAASGGDPLGGRLPDGVRFQSVEVAGSEPSSEDPFEIRFSPEGWADPAVVNLVDADEAVWSVTISPLGGAAAVHASRISLADLAEVARE